MQRPGRRLAVIGLVAALIGMVLAGCESGSTADRTPAVLAHGPTTAPNGFARMNVPISPRRDPLIVAAGNFIIVYGGFVFGGANAKKTQLRPLGDGAVYDVTRGDWTALPELPFEHPLYQPSGTWTGSEVVLAGTPCESTPGEDSESDYVDCKPGGHAIAAYSPTTRRWRTIKTPRGLTADFGGKMTPIQIHAFGYANTRVLFDASVSVTEPRRLLLLDPHSGASRLVSVPDAGIDVVCVTGGKLIAAHTGDANPGPILTFELDATMHWKQLPDAMKATVAPALFVGQPICSAGQLVYFPILQPPVGLDAGALWYLPNQQRWEPLPRFGSLGFPILEPAQVGGTRSLWNGQGDEMYLLPAGARDWVRVERPPGPAGVVGALDNSILMNTTPDTRPAAEPTLALFDPNGFLKPPG